MTHPNQLAPRSTMAGRHRARGATHGPAREARARRSFDAVMASYIRELSAAGDTSPRPRADEFSTRERSILP
jgi:hypothetical protein